MAFTIEQLDQKIIEAQGKLDYWKGLREMVLNPLFRELEQSPNGHRSETRDALMQALRDSTPRPTTPSPEYGAIRRMTLDALPFEGEGVTTNQLAEQLISQGYVFKSKWPTISVNEALRTLQAQGVARPVGKNSSNGVLWLRRADSDIISAESGS